MNSFLRENFWLSLIVACLTGQIICLRLWLRQFDSKIAKNIIKISFIVINLSWAITLVLMRSGAMNDFFWSYFARPSISWQIGSILLLIPVTAISVISLVIKFILLLSKKRKNTALRFSPQPSRRKFLKQAGAFSLLALTAVSGYGIVRQAIKPAVARKIISVPNLHPSLDGLVIGHATDLHLGMWSTQSEVYSCFETIRDEKPDIVFITGDLVDRNPQYASLYHQPLELLSEIPHGVYGVMGNHDHYAGAKKIFELLDKRGITMLVEQRHNFKNLPISVTGLDDQGASVSWLGQYRHKPGVELDPDVLDFSRISGDESRSGDFRILLNHRPEGYRQASLLGYDLYLAGHTHGGQYQIPWNGQDNLASLFYTYSSGLYHVHKAYLNVSKGISSVGLPFRLFAWPEIDMLVLKKA
jgi:predicted MPP superfamily phosphohydrolase